MHIVMVGFERAKKKGDPGIEPGTSCTRNKNHTPRPTARSIVYKIIYNLTNSQLPTFSSDSIYVFKLCILQ